MGVRSRLDSILRLYQLKHQIKGLSFSLSSFIDSESMLGKYVKLNGKTSISKSTIGDYTYFSGSKVDNSVIGKFCSIGPNVLIGGLGKHPINMISTHPSFYSTLMQCGKSFVKKNYFNEFDKTHMGNDVWVGANAIVLDGVNVGNGVIIAAGAVVINDVPSYAIVGGVPAKIIKYRFESEDINILEEIAWWNLTEKELEAIPSIIRNGCVKQLVAYINSIKSPNDPK